MSVIDITVYQPGTSFLDLVCPHCGATEHLEVSVEGYWDCDQCRKGFEIALARVVTVNPLPWSALRLDDHSEPVKKSKSLTKT